MPNRPKKAGRPPSPALEIEILRLDPEGIGIGRLEGREVLVAGAFAGERVLAEIEHSGPRRVIGRLRRVLKPGPDRIPSPCPHAAACQGCLFTGMDYAAQLRFKEEKIRSAFASQSGLGKTPVQGIWPAPQPLAYRTQAKLVFGRQRGKVLLGLYRRGTHEVMDVAVCSLHHPLINRIAAVVREETERQGIFVFDPLRRTGLLRYLAVRVSPIHGRALVTFVTAERNFREITHLAKWLQKKVPEVVGIHQNVNPTEGQAIFGRETLRVLGAPDLLDQAGDIRLRISPISFFQVNHHQAAHFYSLVRQWAGLTRSETAVDLYCGIGGIALHLAQDAGKVVGIEAMEETVRYARENARLNNLRNCTFMAGDAAELLPELPLQSPLGAVVINPPPEGCQRDVLQSLPGLAPRSLLYVSCNPVTLARDLDLLQGVGFHLEKVQPVDMFPQTPHVEAVARLSYGGDHSTRERR